jgi:carboxymethylenebutenolidase
MAQLIDFKIGSVNTTALIAEPAGRGPFPGVVVSFHKGGLDEFTAWVVDDLAQAGFVAVAPNHFHVLPPGKGPDDRRDYLTDEQVGLDLRAGAAWLSARANVRGKTFGLIGHCMGGRNTWLGLADAPELWACGCVWYGGGAKRQMGKVPPPAERFAAIKAPVISFSGKEDINPSPEEIKEFDAALTKLGKWHEIHVYDDTGHGFMNTKSSHYRDKAAKHSRARGYEFLRQHLGVETPAQA